jgi:sec-independent protein translocase protein TatB
VRKVRPYHLCWNAGCKTLEIPASIELLQERTMPSFSDSIFLFVLALLLFGPKKLPMLARELGKWVGEFRRASNEFKMQMEDELRQSEQADRLKKIEAMEAAAPAPPPLPDETVIGLGDSNETAETSTGVSSGEPVTEAIKPLPIAESGDLKIMPPATGLPTPRNGNALGGLLGAIPPAETHVAPENARETVANGD